MAVIPTYRELAQGRISPSSIALMQGLDETYGPESFGPGGALGALQRQGPALRQALGAASAYGLEGLSTHWLGKVAPLLPGAPPDLYLGTLLFTAPAATISVGGRPALALGLERFHPTAPAGEPKFFYRPQEAEEMVPHEAAHAARMQALGLPPTPRRLSLLDMVMLEGTALTFADLLLGRETLATFMPKGQLQWHRHHDREVRAAAAADFGRSGMDAFHRYFGVNSPVSGYYVGYSLCSEFLQRFGPGSIRSLIAMPSQQILETLSNH